MALYVIPTVPATGTVKSIQRGTFAAAPNTNTLTTVIIATVNPLKSIILLDNGAQIASANQTTTYSYPAYVSSFTAGSITFTGGYYSYGGYYYNSTSGWQLIEYV